jgi:hypothetical protein
MAITFPLRLLCCVPQVLVSHVFIFINLQELLNFLLFHQWPTDHWAMCCSASNCLHVFYCCFCCWVLVLMHCDLIECRRLFLFSKICWGLLCDIRYEQLWSRFHELMRRMYIVRKLDEIFCRHQLGPFHLWCDLSLELLYWFFVWMTYQLVIAGYKSLPISLCCSLYIFLGPSGYVWWNWVHWRWVHIGWYCYFLLVYFPFYWYGVYFFILFDECKFKGYFVWD